MLNKTSLRGAACYLMGLTLLGATSELAISAAQAQQTERQYSFNIPARPVPQAVNEIGRIAGISVVFRENSPISPTGSSVRGTMTVSQALSQLLSGTGLSFTYTNDDTVTITNVAQTETSVVAPADGSLVLDTINVVGAGGGGKSSVYSPYETAAVASYISGESIERFRGSSPADIFRGTPGVMSGESRNGAGAIDVNIRGMQGMGRVETTVDGAENSLQVYQGYQGISNRTYVDPDLLGGVDITKGANVSSSGIAGSVTMRTLDAGDILEDDKNFGIRVKGGFGSNTSSPHAGSIAGYDYRNVAWQVGTATPSSDGMDRPAFLEPTQGSGSLVAAMQNDAFDLVAGYAYRKRGNYHAGKNGPYSDPEWIGGVISGSNVYLDVVQNGGIANYRAGEEVLNTQLETKSWLAKGTVHFGDGHSLQLGYTGYRSEAGDLLASRLINNVTQAVQQPQTTGTTVDTGTFKYRWDPDGNELIDFTANLWVSKLQTRNASRTDTYALPNILESLGLPSDFRVGSNTTMWGASVDNKATFDAGLGSIDLVTGISYKSEDASPSSHTREIETWLDYRDGEREEVGTYAKVAYKPWDWLTINAGLRYSYYWSRDRNHPDEERGYIYGASLRNGGFSPSVGMTLAPWDGTQFYVNYSDAMRLPSLFESVSAFTRGVNLNVSPERSRNWEIGTNFIRDSIFTDSDRGMLKVGFFDWSVNDYIAREWYSEEDSSSSSLRMYNIDRAHFQGIELAARYEFNGFTAELAANYYTNVEFCRTSETCGDQSLYADFATNQVPPEYSANLTLSQRFLEEKLTIGGRVLHVGPRAAGHGATTVRGLSNLITLINWEPYTLVDTFAEYKVNENVTASFRVENLFDRFYIDPLGLVNVPGPGRTFYASLTTKF